MTIDIDWLLHNKYDSSSLLMIILYYANYAISLRNIMVCYILVIYSAQVKIS